MSPLTPANLQLALNQLVTSELVSTPPKAAYTFKHALVHDAAYQSLLKAKRQWLHKRTAQLLEQHFQDIAKRRPEVLAYHYFNAQQDREAAHWLLLAGDVAISHAPFGLAGLIGHFRSILPRLG